ncbi:centromere protein C [Oenanthe melanoleuca]|uniref:centromere protein C n=1 Tax=Oenanthe melanoleuca TaxID=2939378 RepID=UPI0024C20770|nr:centromere protein C [Oenanthe melanoleuca]
MAEALNDLKKDYRPRFCHGGGNKIDLRQSQNLVKLIRDCFESYRKDVAMNSPSCSTCILENEERTSMQSQRPKPVLASSVKRTSKSPDTSPVSPLNPVSSRGQACESHVKSATDYVATAEKTESSASKSEEKSTVKDVEARCRCRDVLLGSKDNRGSARSPPPVEEVKRSPVVKLCFDNWGTPAAAESHGEVKNLEGPQPGRDEQVLPVQGTERVTASSARTEKPFSSAVLAAVATRTLGQRYSTSVSPPSPCPMKHQDTEIEDECEFLIDESSDASSTSWISIPTKKKKSKSGGSAAPISKSQPSEKEKTQNKKVKDRKVQVKALTKQKLDHLDVGTSDLKEMPESDPIPNSEENVLTSQSRKSTHTGKTKKDALRQISPNQKKNTSWRSKAEELMLSWSGLETKPSDEEQHKTRMLLSEDLPMPSTRHQEEQTVSQKKSLRSSKNLQLTSETSQDLGKKKQTAEQKLPKVEEAKRGTVNPRKTRKYVQQSNSKKPQLEREESSDSESDEEELEREPVELNEVCTTSLTQKLTRSSVKKKQTVEQEPPKVKEAKRGTVNPRKNPRKSVQQSSSKKPQLEREESSDSESDEEELEREPVELNEVFTTSLTQKLTKSSVKKKQTAKQEPPKVKEAKRGTGNPRKNPRKSVQQSSSKKPQLQREESSESESDDEELEREPVELNEVCTTSLNQKLTKSSVKKKQTAKQELPRVKEAKRGTVNPRKNRRKSVQQSSSKKPQLEREESSDSESDEEELEREPVELNEVCTTSLTQKLTKSSVKKKQAAEQELPRVKEAKRGTVNPRKNPRKSVQQSSSKKPQLEREESSDSESDEEELEREPVELNEVCTTSLNQKLETPVTQKLTKSKKPRNVLHTPESPGCANNRTALKALQYQMERVKNSEKKRLSAKSSGKIPNKIPRRAIKALSSSSEDTESQTDSDSSSVPDVARKRPKLPDVKIKSNKRKRDMQHGPQDSCVPAKILNCESGPVLEDSDLFTSSTKSSEQDDTYSDSSEEMNYKLRRLLADEVARHKIVMPSNTPNVRRTKRIRLRPLEYWRGERVNYTMDPSGGLVVSGVVHPETESLTKSKKRKKDHSKEKTDTNRGEVPVILNHSVTGGSEPIIVRDPVTNEEVLLDCIRTANCVSCHRKDEAAEVYKDLSTSHFATGVLILKPLRVKGRQFVYKNTIVFRILRGEVIATIHKASYYLSTGDCFYVPAGNEYDLYNPRNEPSVFVFTQFKQR